MITRPKWFVNKNLRCYADCAEALCFAFDLYSMYGQMYSAGMNISYGVYLPKSASVGTRFGLSVYTIASMFEPACRERITNLCQPRFRKNTRGFSVNGVLPPFRPLTLVHCQLLLHRL